MTDLSSRAERYRKEANRYAELAKGAPARVSRRRLSEVAVWYVFMAEELLKGPGRNGDAGRTG